MDLEKIALKESMKNPQQGQEMMPPGMGGGMPPM